MHLPETEIMEVMSLPEKAPTSLEARVERLEAKESIRNLIMEYSFHCDSKKYDQLVDRFCTKDVTMVRGDTLQGRFEGAEEVKAAWRGGAVRRRDGKLYKGTPTKLVSGIRGRHMMYPSMIRISDDGKQAWGAWYFSGVRSTFSDDGMARGIHDGTDLFTFVKEGDEWKIRKMVINTEIGYDTHIQWVEP